MNFIELKIGVRNMDRLESGDNMAHIYHFWIHNDGKYIFDRKEIDECNCDHHILCRGKV